ncbi:bacillithiol biosynthesis cysteine-adding enzyme BshC [Echinicola jeungdonensis]|uniref:Putative cysteine ligase BshC n=1 Tax=Echinicola jeungdonensis TaxID=709343 RepID=A0ABV5J6G7_9BACT|nr:bacillithiol biosynthesis cysteine-adding enzyme BshC [Echinicola jeungdonensis]MDN3668859.1 bacillithiol biosynthesis cysteine-adding enzyme BshC [Echinicola jeungdonensis]
MLKSTVEPECTGQFSSIFIDYIRKNEKLRPFYCEFPNLENFKKVIKSRNLEVEKRKVLVQSLERQYGNMELTSPVSSNIQALADENTFTVTTGHQLNLFTGPLYFIYKIVSTINLAQKLSEEYTDYRFVPVYWMATEDHDFEEINHFTYEGKKYTWNSKQKGAVGDFVKDEELEALLKELTFVPDFFKKAYLGSRNLAEAVRKYVDHLFGEKGLVILDGNDPALKQIFAPVIKDDILSNKANDLVNEQTAKLEKLGYQSQVFPREINFFYLEKGLRSRIVKKGNEYHIIDTELRFPEDELLRLIEENPEKFSPNVVMRPLYQECVLPNLAYLGGPAEIAYWLQLKLVFDHYKISFPLLLPRNFALIFDVKVQRKMKALELEKADVFENYQDWKKEYVKRNSISDLELEKEHKIISDLFDELGESAAEIDPSLNPSSEAAKVRANKVLDHFGKKLRRAEEKRLEIGLRQMGEIKEILFPGGVAQERKDNFLPYYLENSGFIEELHQNFDPLEFDFIILEKDGSKG